MKVSILGPLSVQSGGRRFGPGDLRGPKPKALLEILLLARGNLVSKDRLVDLVWPGPLPRHPLATLEHYVSVLRRDLFADQAKARRVIVTERGAYRLERDEVILDVVCFDRLLAEAERTQGRDRRALWVEAVGLVTGDLLADEPDAVWAEAERNLYRDHISNTQLLIADDALASGDYATALRHADDALRIDPYEEKAVRSVMLAHHARGHSDTSRRVFLRCRKVLEDGLGNDPSTATADLAGAIDAGTPARELIDAALPTPATMIRPHPRDRRSPTRRMPFLGRAAELARLGAHVERTRQGRFGLFVVEGRPGFGRTAMLDHLRHSLRGTVGRAAYLQRDTELPSLPLAAALRDALRRSPGASDAEHYANAPWLSAEEALESLLHLVRAHSPMVLLLDDLHWADPDTIHALNWLDRHAQDVPLAIIATVRFSASEGGFSIGRLSAVDRLRLGPLTPADSSGVADVDEEMILATGGDPRLMADLWRWKRAGEAGVSPSLEEAVKRRVRGLGGCIPTLLQAAAVRAEPFDLTDLMGASGPHGGVTVTDVGRLCDLELLETTAGGFRFTAPLVRDVLATTVTPERRALLAAALADIATVTAA